MARIFNGTTHYLRRAVANLAGAPLTMASWVKVTDGTAAQTAVALSDEAGANNYSMSTVFENTHSSSTRMATTTTYEARGTTPVITDGEWALLVAVNASDVSRASYVNGGNKAVDTADAGTFTANYDNITVGALRRSTVSNYFGGKIHSVAVWNKALSDAEVAALWAGGKLGSVARSSLVGYWPDLGTTLVGEVGGTLVDIAGTTTVDADAPTMASGLRKVYALSSVTGLKKWVDYLPVKVQTSHTAASIGTYNDNGALLVEPLASVAGLTAWVDYTPVYVVADTNGYSYDDDGYLWVTGV